ncbi:MAG TPA: hypothetical protein VEQ59_20970 [Polyangiaceae bacterium]|nr:hypothetical protein [Polyangiaceae bacterium]
MSKSFALLVVVTTLVACGGSTGTADPSEAGSTSASGSSAGGNSGAGDGGKATSGAGGVKPGTAGSGGVTQGGVSSGGVSNAGSSNGGISSAGISSGGISSGGAGGMSIDPRCPPQAPEGTCVYEGASCEYSLLNSCLCYPSPPNTFTPCTQADPTCKASGGAGGASPAPPPGGTGGINTKIAAPSHHRCTCTDSAWSCVYGL